MSQNFYPNDPNVNFENQNINDSGQIYNANNINQEQIWQNNSQGSNLQDDFVNRNPIKFIAIILGLIILLIIAIVALGVYYNKSSKQNLSYNPGIEINDDAQSAERKLSEKKDYRPYLGNVNAPLVIVEFSDFQCSKSQEEFSQIRQAVLNNGNDVLFIFRHFPVIDNNSSVLAKAGACASEQEKFWQFHDKLFSNIDKITSTEVVKEFALQSGMDVDKFSQCLESEKYNSLIEEDVNDAKALGVIGTPTFFVNGRKVEGTIRASDWEEIIKRYKEALKRK